MVTTRASFFSLASLRLLVFALGAIAGIAFAFYFVVMRNEDAGTNTSLRQKVAFYELLSARQEEIFSLYSELENRYVEATGRLATLKIDPAVSDKEFIETLLRQDLQNAGAEDIEITSGDVEQLKNARRLFVNIGFLTSSHADTLNLLFNFSNPTNGFKWHQFDLAADRRQKNLRIDGQLEVLIIDLPKV